MEIASFKEPGTTADDPLSSGISAVKGVGPKVAQALEERGIRSVEDLLYFLPIRYHDRRVIQQVKDLREGERAILVGRVVAGREAFFRSSRRRLYQAMLDDGTGTVLLKWFRFARQYMRRICAKGNRLLVSAVVTRFNAQWQMVHPDVVLLDDEEDAADHQAIIPVYPEVEGLKQGSLRRIIRNALEEYSSHVESILPARFERKYAIPGLTESIRNIHFPGDDLPAQGTRNPYVERVICEEFLLFQTALLLAKGDVKKERGISFKAGGRLHKGLQCRLSFELTAAQQRVMREIAGDMACAEPMNRLLQGDVGCGKTICALLALCIAVDKGYQAALMAPTEILAEQHYLSIHRALEEIGIRPVLLRGNMGRGRGEIIEGIAAGRIPVVVGTHALLQGDVKFKRLGLVIIDEQHRFGVVQRKKLREKGVSPDVLVMTATPIPRTLSMVIYGDLDVSIIDELPAGRQNVWTKVFPEKERPAVYRLIEGEVAQGHQVYIVYPLVDESDKMELLSATERLQHLQQSVFPHLRIGLLHGRMKAEEKEKVMLNFKEGNVDILVCTTVIEVGIDVPNATVIVVEHAERFGLSQLHQLRGRVGRGAHASKCLLVSAAKRTELATKRLKIMEETGDGFRIAEEDMEIRGPGEMLGVRQAGIPRFRAGDLVRDGDLMSLARKMAEEILPIFTPRLRERVEKMIDARWGRGLRFYDVA